MLVRILTGIMIAIVLIGAGLLGKSTMLLAISISSIIAVNELYNAIGLKSKTFRGLSFASLIIYYLGIDFFAQHFILYMFIVLITHLVIFALSYPKINFKEVTYSMVGLLYPGIIFSFIVLLFNYEMYEFWVASIFLIACCSDTFAYFTGIFIGKHKLAPLLSPKKTIEGSIGGVIGTGIATIIFVYAFSIKYPLLQEHLWFITMLYMVLAALSQIGDLVASAIKREFNIKDYGKVLPGHGGILDRFDSIIFIAPLIYFIATLIG